MAVKVSELNYERVTIEEFTREMEAVIRQVKEAQTASDVLAARDRCNALSVRWQTAEALISIAHPDFRDQLIAEAEKMHIWKRSNKR